MSDDIIIGLRLKSDGSAEVVQDVSRVQGATDRLAQTTDASGKAATRTGRAVSDYAREHDRASRSVMQMNDQQRRLIRTLVSGAAAWLSLRGAARLGDMYTASQMALAQLDAALASTENAAGFTREQLVLMSQEAARATTHTADQIQRAQVRLLSYSTIAGDTFPAALQATIDQAARLGMEIEQSAEVIGRAIELPSRGMTSLSRQGFQFTEEMLRQAQVLEDSGRLHEAQAMVLGVLAESYGGAGAASLQAVGSQAKFREEAINVGAALGGIITRVQEGFLPSLEAAAHLIGADLNRVLRDSGDEIDDFSDAVLHGARRMLIGTAGIVDTLAAPLGVIKGLARDIWAGFEELGQIPGGQEIGILGLLLSGTKGRVAILGAMKFMADARTTADWWRAYQSGAVGFTEWFTTGHDEAARRLDELRAAGADIGNASDPIVVKLFGTGDEQEEALGAAESRVVAFLNRMDALMEERRRSSTGGGSSFSFTPFEGGDSPGFTEDEQDQRLVAFERLQESLLTEEDALAQSYQRRAQVVGEALAARVTSEEAALAALQALETDYQKRRSELQIKTEREIASVREGAVRNAVGLLNTLAGESKVAAVASIAITKGLAMAQTWAHTQTASMLAYASQLVPGDPSSPARAEAARAYTLGIGKLSMGLIAATGLVEAAQAMGGGGGGGGGGGSGGASPVFSADPLTGIPTDSGSQRQERTVQVVFQDSAFYGYDDYATEQIMQRIETAVREADRVFISRGSRQAQELGVG